MSDEPTTGPKPDEANKRNEHDASEADKRTVEKIRRNQSDKEQSEPEFRPIT